MKEYALITGASKGIGKSTALLLAQKGYNLLLVARSENELEDL
jgi:short-subunit dehydrogenase